MSKYLLLKKLGGLLLLVILVLVVSVAAQADGATTVPPPTPDSSYSDYSTWCSSIRTGCLQESRWNALDSAGRAEDIEARTRSAGEIAKLETEQAAAAASAHCAQGSPVCTYANITPACRTGGTCNAAERNAILNALGYKCGREPCSPEEQALLARARQQYEQAQQSAASKGQCDWWTFEFKTCVWIPAMTWVSAGFIWIGVTVATAAGGVFEAALKYLIVDFGHYLGLIKPGIDVGWTALRDIANIVIIGMFVFIAINIILGVHQFGDKKKVAQVLIVAVLINFSLLFTKVIVDASNFTAYQFYNSMVRGSGVNVNQSVGDAGFEASLTSSGIAGKFMQLLGIKGVAGQDQQKLAEYARKPDAGALYALGYGLFAFIFLLAVAFVLLYGAFLIMSRAVLIVFLMLTSAVAFATWLIPQHYVEKGFAKWWESLLKTAFFAPILMALLWVTINVSEAFVKALGDNRGALGVLASKPSDDASALAVLSFIVVLGLLYASFATASAFSKTISGFRFAKAAVGLPVGTALAGTLRTAGFAGRRTAGGLTGAAARFIQDKGWTADGKEGKGFRAALARTAWRPLAGVAKSSFDAMNTATGQKLVESLGGHTFGKEVGAGGHWGDMERAAARLEKQGRAMAPSGDARKELVDKAGAAVAKQIEKKSHALNSDIKTTKDGARIEGERDAAEARINSLEKKQAALGENFAKRMEDQKNNPAAVASLQQAKSKEIGEIQAQINAERTTSAKRQTELNEWKKAVDAAGKTIAGPLSEEVSRLEGELRNLEAGKDKRVADARDERNAELQGRAIAESTARSILNIGKRNELVRNIGSAAKKHDLAEFAAAVVHAGGAPSKPKTEGVVHHDEPAHEAPPAETTHH